MSYYKILFELFAGIIAKGKKVRFIQQALYYITDLVPRQGDQLTEDNELDSQKESNNKFILKEEEVAA